MKANTMFIILCLSLSTLCVSSQSTSVHGKIFVPNRAVKLSSDGNYPFDLSKEDGAQPYFMTPRLRFYPIGKRAAGEMEQSEGQNPETKSHSWRKRSVLTPSLSSLGESLESGISKRISINQDLKAITDMLLTEQIQARRRCLAALRQRLLDLGKRDSDVSLFNGDLLPNGRCS
uniref:Egg-laying hormone-related A n=1 Tax=Aplysia californica TaxID=6500 RepID=O16847_APLCA|nr:egg-laying hormone-related precursor A [Aplysia californica]